MEIKTRFGPSPTGNLHIGNIRTALYSWLFARNKGGKFVLRIEDSDKERSAIEDSQNIMRSMIWLGLKWDEGPYFQTKRFDRYRSVICSMLEAGTVYKCYCSKQRLEKLRKKQISKGEKPRYDGYCRYNSRKFTTSKDNYVIRFANPKDGYVVFEDQIRGTIKFSNQELDDLIICRTDGSPTYNFCVVIDDMDMAITHVIRGEDHINNTPRQINILKALNASIPIYAHVSIVNGYDGKKISKRNGALSVMQYRDAGYLPEALLNYLVRLGWSRGNQEIFSLEEMIQYFTLNTLSKSPSIFNVNKLLWLNQYYINNLPIAYVAKHLQWHIKQMNIDTHNGPELSDLIKIMGKRCKTLKDIAKDCRYFYEEFNTFIDDSLNKYLNASSLRLLEIIREKFLVIKEWKVENIHFVIRSVANQLAINIGQVSMPLRIAVTGTIRSPSLDVTIYAIGKNRIINRINKALDFIRNNEKLLINKIEYKD